MMQFRCRNVNGSFNLPAMMEASQTKKVLYHEPKRIDGTAAWRPACSQAQAQTKRLAEEVFPPRHSAVPFACGLRCGIQTGCFRSGRQDADGREHLLSRQRPTPDRAELLAAGA